MQRLSAIFVAVCIVLIAGSLGIVLYLVFGLTGAESSLIALTALTGLALYNTVSTRLRDRSDFSDQIAELARGTADLARQVGEMNRRLSTVEQNAEATLTKARKATEPLAAEIGELGTLVKQLAETVAHESSRTLDSRKSTLSMLPPTAVMPMASEAMKLVAPPSVAPPSVTLPSAATPPAPDGPPPPTSGPFKGLSQDAVIAMVREAIDSSRVDLYLQPIVTLPQRKVRYYEAMTRLRSEDGDVILAADFLPYAEVGGLMPKVDNLLLFRCVQVIRRLLVKNREIGVFCNISMSTLADADFFTQVSDFLEANKAIAPSLVLEFTQGALRSMGPIETECLAALAARGFRFSVDNVTDLRMEPRDLSERGVRFVKVPASLLLNRAGSAGSDIHAADLSDLLGRFGVSLIATGIENESAVVDLLDYDVRFGQGFLFSPPRPVRAGALQGLSERADVVVREGGEAADGGTAAPSPAQRAGVG